MNNEPVAWMSNESFEVSTLNIGRFDIPLYTHPASLVDWSYQQGYQVGKETHPAKTLTDEEIYKIANSIETIQPQHGLRLSNDLNVMDFARAILRKAQDNG